MGLANVAVATGYDAIYKGKFHLTNAKTQGEKKQTSDVASAYGWNRWVGLIPGVPGRWELQVFSNQKATGTPEVFDKPSH
jgi:hypothetical protein